jgi:hypothetical protein
MLMLVMIYRWSGLLVIVPHAHVPHVPIPHHLVLLLHTPVLPIGTTGNTIGLLRRAHVIRVLLELVPQVPIDGFRVWLVNNWYSFIWAMVVRRCRSVDGLNWAGWWVYSSPIISDSIHRLEMGCPFNVARLDQHRLKIAQG